MSDDEHHSDLGPIEIDPASADVSMKPMLGILVQEAVKLALVDVTMVVEAKAGGKLEVGDRLYEPLPAMPMEHEPTPAFIDHVGVGTGGILASPGPASLARLAEDNDVELVDFGQFLGRKIHDVTEVHDLIEGYTSVVLDGDDRWRLHIPDTMDLQVERYPTDEERAAWRLDIYSAPQNDFDPIALAQSVACRLLGTGGWAVNGVYAPNATATDVLNATLERPDQDFNAELAFDLGLGAPEAASAAEVFSRPECTFVYCPHPEFCSKACPTPRSGGPDPCET